MKVLPTTDGATILLDDRKRIDSVCDRFEAAWRRGERPDLLSFLSGIAEPVRSQLFRELLALELELRRGDGERLDPRSYRDRYREYSAIIDAAFAMEPSAETTDTPSGDPGATQPGTGPSRGGGYDRIEEALHAAGYEVERELGRGGMGIVYRARQMALNRTVALKVIRAGGFATDAERLRFQNEAEAVAQLDHPQIVPIHEVGERGGLLYFSMKLVTGAGLDERLDHYQGDPRASARVTMLVAEAVHHAHQRGILHRDLKPANILLDERGDPHVTDFGLARRIEGEGELTRSGLIVGTPSYMSPEQASGKKGTPLTTATDVYGLGSILYALLAGRAPHAGSSLVETLDLVREASPEPPSRRNPIVPRDLEVICLKCLEKDPSRRYPDAQALADDLQRWLSGQPITARPVGPLTRLAMWCRRHPLPAALAALLVVSVIGGFAGVTWKWREAERARLKSAALLDYLTNEVLSEASTEVNPRSARFTVLEMLDRSSARIGGDFQGRPEIEAAIREAVGGAYLSLGQHAQAEAHLRGALKLDTQLYGPEHAATLHVANLLADLLDQCGRYEEAEPLIRRNLEVCRRVLGPDDPTTLAAANHLGALLRKQKRLDEAEPFLRTTLATRRKALPVDHPDTLQSVRNLSLLLVDRARFDEADALAQEYEHGIRCTRGPKHPDNVAALANRGLIRRLQGRLDLAEPYYRQARDEARRILGDEHPLTLAAVNDHANILNALGKPAEQPEPELPDDPFAP
jgi:serine/threonine protein kinase/tetratricopeptide (TPR) repeat protein